MCVNKGNVLLCSGLVPGEFSLVWVRVKVPAANPWHKAAFLLVETMQPSAI